MLVYVCKTPLHPFPSIQLFSKFLTLPLLFLIALPSFSHFLFHQRHPATTPGLSPGHCHCPHPYTFILSKGWRKGPSHHLSKPGYQVTWQLQPSLFLPSLQTRTEAIFVCLHLLESFHLQKYQEISGELLTVEFIKQSFPPYKEMSESSSL